MSAKKLPEGLEDFNVFTLKFHMLDTIKEALSCFNALNVLNGTQFQRFISVFEKVMEITSMRHGSSLG